MCQINIKSDVDDRLMNLLINDKIQICLDAISEFPYRSNEIYHPHFDNISI